MVLFTVKESLSIEKFTYFNNNSPSRLTIPPYVVYLDSSQGFQNSFGPRGRASLPLRANAGAWAFWIDAMNKPNLYRGLSSFRADVEVEIPAGTPNPFVYFQRVIDTLKPWATLHIVSTRIDGSIHNFADGTITPTLYEIAGEKAFDEMVARGLEPLPGKAAKEFTPDLLYARLDRLVSDLRSEIGRVSANVSRIADKLNPDVIRDEPDDDPQSRFLAESGVW